MRRYHHWRAALGLLLLLHTPSQALDFDQIVNLYNPRCVQYMPFLGVCYCNLYTPCTIVGYWEPAWLVETVKGSGTTSLQPFKLLMDALWGAVGIAGLLGGGGAGNAAGGIGNTNLQFNEAHIITFPQYLGGPCDSCNSRTQFTVHYLSEIDPLWRTATGLPALSGILGSGELGVWAPLYPRGGPAITGSEPVGSGIAAARAIHIAAHPTGSVTSPEYRVVLQQIQGGSRCCQLASPKQTGCFPVGTNPVRWESGAVSENGTYQWVFWRYRTCCIEFQDAFGPCGIAALAGGGGANTCLPSDSSMGGSSGSGGSGGGDTPQGEN